jgi:hypothetical protein
MNNYLFYGLVYFFMTINADKTKSQEVTASATTQAKQSTTTYFSDDLVYNDDLYTLLLRVDKQKNGEHLMSIQMQLKKDSYFVSPNTKGNFSGRFTIVWDNADFLNRDQALIETPVSVEEFERPVNLVRVNTTYKQSLRVLTNKNFDVSGYLQFTIEPRCTLEKVPFILTYVNGRLSVKTNGC